MADSVVIITSVGAVLASREALVRLSQREAPVAAALAVMGLTKFLAPLVADFVARRHAILKAHGTAAGENRWKLDPAQRDVFEKELQLVADEEVRVPLALSLTLGDLAEVKISAGDLERIAFLVRDLD